MATSSSSSQIGISRVGSSSQAVMPVLGSAQFREIHKNTWLKRLTAEGKKITVGPKKSERSWVVFCVHDDTEAILEGYAEPRQAASHNPEWFVSMQTTQHISHALIPNSNEFEFVVTLSDEVIRFHAMSWETMQEWVDTLRSKLREMKILSPRENLYTKLPEARPPLLPTRDPTSPLPAPPPVPAAIVPGVELVVPQNILQNITTTTATNAAVPITTTTITTTAAATSTTTTTTTSLNASSSTTTTHIPAMSNTLTQNLLNMLSDPISAYSEQLQNATDSRGSSNDIENVIVNEQLSTSLNDLQLMSSDFNEDGDCLSPLLRPSSSSADPSRKRHSADHARNIDNVVQCDRLIPRPHTSRSHSVGAADKGKNAATISTSLATMHNNQDILATSGEKNITELEITAETTQTTIPFLTTTNHSNDEDENTKTNITIIQVSTDTDENQLPNPLPLKINANHQATDEIFKFPEISNTTTTKQQKQHEYKSNVQLIPSSNNVNSSTIKVLGDVTTSSTAQFSTPIKKPSSSSSSLSSSASIITQTESNQVTTVHVGGGPVTTTASVSVYGTCYTPPPPAAASQSSSPMSTPKLPKKIILTANTSGITNITVDNNSPSVAHGKIKSKSKNLESTSSNNTITVGNVHYEKVFLSSSTPIVTTNSSTVSATAVNTYVSSPTTRSKVVDCISPMRHKTNTAEAAAAAAAATSTTSTSVQSANASKRSNKSVQTVKTDVVVVTPPPILPVRIGGVGGSPALQRRAVALRPPAHMLKRGQTEAVITARPSRRDIFYFNNGVNLLQQQSNNRTNNKTIQHAAAAANNNENGDTPNDDVIDQRRRSSSTSDARVIQQRSVRGANNNEFAASNRAPPTTAAALRIQQPPVGSGGGGGAAVACMSPPPSGAAASASKRMTLREQQVMQLRREIMHPGGVRLQLRRKDCIGSIAFVEVFGAVWVAGWKQKEHPVLYNALHIGDQLLSIAGVTVNTATEANKIIRNANTLFVEVLIRRMPFGRGYAIRREREGQCLGLIRDGNTATIVDVVPNSLAARHGLPPKAQSCDGTTLTFWMLTEINGRPLNLFFKENEIRDRLNSVGRDISILVQPSDLITKLKKQLKSLRGYKDYLVQ